ncbi:Lrp/AsnC family transcriptional regulator [Haloarchaeobius salinus]|uniref:Lrp/AsnC family transcriptional regulator n=1 Tax=Haloarchaeobius salinus TaxID=1198298 RepID=UPI00210A8748|nr:winged helix-turn-helix transcriptional regulator [Haloarchaeobius salinus]
MRQLDDTDLEILRLLLEDASRTYSDIAEIVDVSPPTVSDRIDRLREMGVIRRFTIDLDSSKLNDGVSVLVEAELSPTVDDGVLERFAALEDVEHAFLTADSRVFLNANVPEGDVRQLLAGGVDLDLVERFDVSLLVQSEWRPKVKDRDAGTEGGLEQTVRQ